MNLIGCRVVRGPNWIWGDQDGGEGGVGTIVNTDTSSDGTPLKQQTVLVHWDYGREAAYRLGRYGKLDLGILDSAPTRVCFKNVRCSGCGQNPLLGTRWTCTDCDDYHLCTHCYNNDIHDLDHNFLRYDYCNQQCFFVGQRSSAALVQAKGIFPGSVVTTGKDCEYDLGSMIGIVRDHRESEETPVGKVRVEWCQYSSSFMEMEHRLGSDGKVDLKLETFVPDMYYYRDHLMFPIIVVQLQVGDKVTVHLDINHLHRSIVNRFGHWEPKMERGISEVGTVAKVDENEVEVKYETPEERLVFPNHVFLKVHDLRVNDRVLISDYKEKVVILQKGLAGWNDEMENVLGKEGQVIEVDEKGNASVKVGEDIWWFNPAALFLESKEEERESASTFMTISAKENAERDDGASTVVKQSSKKSIPEEFLDRISEITSGVTNLVKEVKEEKVMSKAWEECVDWWKNKLPEVPANLESTGGSSMDTEVDDAFEGQACAPLQSRESTEDLESFDEDEDESVFVRPTNMDDIPLDERPDQTDNVYKMTSYPRGVVMIVNIEHFNVDPKHPMYGKLDDRVGAKRDEENVAFLFQHLGFIVETINKTSGNDLLAELHRISSDYDFSEFDCFVLFIMSHGAINCIYASDGRQLTPSLIVSLFRNSKCKSLAGKPKLFFFQGCRGEKKDGGVILADAPGDSITATSRATSELNDADKIPETCDVLEFYSCHAGYKSFRNSETGSPFVQIIVKVFRKYACRYPISKLSTKVNDRVSELNYDGEKQMSQCVHSLKKELYFWPGLVFDE